jgi:hypothetical protein
VLAACVDYEIKEGRKSKLTMWWSIPWNLSSSEMTESELAFPQEENDGFNGKFSHFLYGTKQEMYMRMKPNISLVSLSLLLFNFHRSISLLCFGKVAIHCEM